MKQRERSGKQKRRARSAPYLRLVGVDFEVCDSRHEPSVIVHSTCLKKLDGVSIDEMLIEGPPDHKIATKIGGKRGIQG
jgi:hypothetical protein